MFENAINIWTKASEAEHARQTEVLSPGDVCLFASIL